MHTPGTHSKNQSLAWPNYSALAASGNADHQTSLNAINLIGSNSISINNSTHSTNPEIGNFKWNGTTYPSKSDSANNNGNVNQLVAAALAAAAVFPNSTGTGGTGPSPQSQLQSILHGGGLKSSMFNAKSSHQIESGMHHHHHRHHHHHTQNAAMAKLFGPNGQFPIEELLSQSAAGVGAQIIPGVGTEFAPSAPTLTTGRPASVSASPYAKLKLKSEKLLDMQHAAILQHHHHGHHSMPPVINVENVNFYSTLPPPHAAAQIAPTSSASHILDEMAASSLVSRHQSHHHHHNHHKSSPQVYAHQQSSSKASKSCGKCNHTEGVSSSSKRRTVSPTTVSPAQQLEKHSPDHHHHHHHHSFHRHSSMPSVNQPQQQQQQHQSSCSSNNNKAMTADAAKAMAFNLAKLINQAAVAAAVSGGSSHHQKSPEKSSPRLPKSASFVKNASNPHGSFAVEKDETDSVVSVSSSSSVSVKSADLQRRTSRKSSSIKTPGDKAESKLSKELVCKQEAVEDSTAMSRSSSIGSSVNLIVDETSLVVCDPLQPALDSSANKSKEEISDEKFQDGNQKAKPGELEKESDSSPATVSSSMETDDDKKSPVIDSQDSNANSLPSCDDNSEQTKCELQNQASGGASNDNASSNRPAVLISSVSYDGENGSLTLNTQFSTTAVDGESKRIDEPSLVQPEEEEKLVESIWIPKFCEVI
jgi:hypothetical protein